MAKQGKYRITAEFALETQIEPEGVDFDRYSDAEQFSDDSYFGAEGVTSYGGSIQFELEADDEVDAESKAEDVIFDGQEVEDNNGLTWQVTNLSVEVEELEAPVSEPTLAEALVVVRMHLEDLQRQGALDPALAAAFLVVLEALEKLVEGESSGSVARDAQDEWDREQNLA